MAMSIMKVGLQMRQQKLCKKWIHTLHNALHKLLCLPWKNNLELTLMERSHLTTSKVARNLFKSIGVTSWMMTILMSWQWVNIIHDHKYWHSHHNQALAVKVFSAMPISMVDEHTMFIMTWLNSPRHRHQKISTVADHLVIHVESQQVPRAHSALGLNPYTAQWQ